MNRRVASSVVSVVVAMSVILAGCAKKSDPGPATVKVEKITIWTQKNFNQVVNDEFQKVADAFAKEKGVKVDVVYTPFQELPNKLTAAIEGKSLPDISIVESPGATALYQKANLLEDLSDVVTGFGKPLPLVDETTKISGKYYSIVPTVSLMPMQYRKDYLQAAGVSVPDTWEQLAAAAKKLTDPAKKRFGLALVLGKSNDSEAMIRPMLWSYGGREFSTDGTKATINSPETVAALKFITQLYKDGVPPGATGWDLQGDNKSYESGETAFNMNNGTIIAKAVSPTGDKNLDTNTQVTIPMAGPKDRLTFAYVDTYVAFKGPGSSVAKEFFRFLSKRDNYIAHLKSFGGYNVPGYDGALPASDPYYQEEPRRGVFVKGAQYAHAMGWPGPATAASNEIFNRGLLTDMVQKVLLKNVTPEKAAEEANQAYQGVIDSYRK